MKKRKIGTMLLVLIILFSLMPTKTFAANKMQLNKTSKTLYLNEDNKTNTANTFDFAVKNKPSDYKTKYLFTWSSDNTQIVTINSSGLVTAKKAGTTTIKCTIRQRSNNKLVSTLKATVTVKENARQVSITNGLEGSVLNVGEDYQFKCKQKGESGGKSTDKKEWSVSDESVGSVTDSGLFTALKPGETTLQVKTYQSAATLSEGYTAESEPLTIIVVGEEDPALDTRTARPEIMSSIESGNRFTDSCEVQISCSTEGAVIYYTTDGKAPVVGESFVYEEPITLSESTAIRAIAMKAGLDNSTVATAIFRKSLSISGTATIVGEAKYGKTLEADISNIIVPEGEKDETSFFYQWKRDGEEVDEGNLTYTLTTEDIGKEITCTISHSSFMGEITAKLSDKVEKADAPTVTPYDLIPIEKGLEKEYTFFLSNLVMPEDADSLLYSIGTPSNEKLFKVAPDTDWNEDYGMLLCFTASNEAELGDTAEVYVTISSTNYKDVSVPFTFIVQKRPIAISGVSVESRDYNGTTIVMKGTPIAKHDDTLVSISDYDYIWCDEDGTRLETAPRNVGDYKLTVSVKETDTNYAGSVDLLFSINPKPLTIKADDKRILIGETIPEYTFTANGLVSGESISDVTYDENGAVNNAKGSFSITPKGCTITKSGGTSGDSTDNYSITYESGTLTVRVDTSSIDTALAVANAAKNGVATDNRGTNQVASGTKFVSTGVMSALNTAIDTTKSKKDTVSDITEAQAAAEELNSAVATFKTAIQIGTYVAPSGGTSGDSSNSESGSTSTQSVTPVGKPTITPVKPQEKLSKPENGKNTSETETTQKQPTVNDDKSIDGWADNQKKIQKEFDKALKEAGLSEGENLAEPVSVAVDMGDSTTLPKDVISLLQGKNINLALSMGAGIQWTINGLSITGENLSDIDLGVTKNVKKIPADIINQVEGEHLCIQIELSHNGEFGFEAVLTLDLNKDNAGQYANLFYYNETIGKLEYMNSALIDKDGNAALTFHHASTYTIVICEEELDETALNTDASEKGTGDTAVATQKNIEATEENSSNMLALWIAIGVVIVVLVGGTVIYLKKKQER